MGKYNQHYSIMSAIKRCFSKSPLHKEVMLNAKCPRKKGPRGGAQYRCKDCRKPFGPKKVQVDHIDPVVPIGTMSKNMSWDQLVSRIFCDVDNLQVLCKDCHTKKSQKESKLRKEAKDAE